MAKMGKKPVEIPEGVIVEKSGESIRVSGPKGTLSLSLPEGLEVKVEDGKAWILQKNSSRKTRALQGTIRNLLANMGKGMKDGWSKTLEIVGTGFRAALEGEKLVLSLGFSHPVEIIPKEGISFSVAQNKVTISGIDKALVGKVAAEIRAIKPPDAYKGKGIRYENEIIKLKPGKQVKVGAGGASSQKG